MPILDNITDKLFGSNEDDDNNNNNDSRDSYPNMEDSKASYDMSFDADEGYGGEHGSDQMPSKHRDTNYNPNDASTEVTSSMDSTNTQNKNFSHMGSNAKQKDGDGFSWSSN
ncbi:uncharacterized protein RNJ42_02405 [Nakaseomyces bracarensis]|uniref:uncharacterized protein n=1 Tax=Nakaseomyces bracarensis TaxID=273131 RepID=UPI003872006C